MCVSIQAQVLPPIQGYSPEMYGADNQNWSVSQTENKYVYVANNSGLLEFDGETWQLYESPSGKMRSVKVIDNLIYTGCYREFGYWKRDVLGELNYTSLSQNLKVEFLEDEEFWNIIALDNWILFQSLSRIYIYNKTTQSLNIIDSDSIIYKIFEVGKVIYFQKVRDGLYKIEGGKPQLVSNHQIFKENYLVNLFNLNNELLVQTEKNGFYIFSKDNSLNKWDIPASNILSKVSVYRSKRLQDSSFIIGTRSNGILHITPNGEVDYTINFSNGLLNNAIHDVFEDSENNIWLALENGINCINVKSPFELYHDKDGKLGTIYTSIYYNNILYLGTNQGLFYKPNNDSSSSFKFIEGTEGPVWSLVSYQNTLFCGHNLGTIIIENGEIKNKIDINGTWNIIPIPNKSNQLLVGNYDGLSVIEKRNDIWRFKHKIEGFNTSSKFFEVVDNNIFVSHEYKGVFKLKTNTDFTKIIETKEEKSLEQGLNSSLVKFNDKLYYAYIGGVYNYNKSQEAFVKDSLMSGLFDNDTYTSGKLIVDAENKMLWNFARKKLSYISSGKLSSNPTVTTIPFSELLPHGLTGSENISHLNDQKYVIGTSEGYIILNLNKIKHKTFKIALNSIAVSDIENEFVQRIDRSKFTEFKNKHNNIVFSFSVPEYNKYLDTEYQYKLTGLYPNWSPWSSNPSIFFKNLPYGDYQFQVRAKVGDTLSENTETFSFTIEKPWYLTNVMVVVYLIGALIIIVTTHNIYKRYYRKQRESLMRKTARELELKELENKQQLMRFNNEKLRQDIDNKSRELGISTMNIIKKNEVLGHIKKELSNVNEVSQLKKVIGVIDKNLNNSDDWNLFEEAFNNADKDFLKKIKGMHPELTTNDLRLCTYLRLNLSSKEIAPLLNISPRSVEVKRYRLRKKLNLEHESSLSDYILEI
ncbi:triple tyrosine motif-containing protein [Seonamhaeicola sediminis]|uniref:triple tyrosine motif-containing protein n=1 Tax=Seonamhaeicola sediminis TaxID=2528206 RepID=UPI002107B701|nr:triple tyrosine motif-containing protein [Seonamhaeicola sediminis]